MSTQDASVAFPKEETYYHEKIKRGLWTSYQVIDMEFSGESKFQSVQVFNTEPFGQVLVTDGLLQSTEIDEHVYHESLVQPALCLHPSPKKVYIGGGGEGATLREVLKHACVERCDMVDIDGYVVDNCRKYMPKHSAGAFEAKRCNLVIADARTELEKVPDSTYDVIIMDLSDPLEAGPCYKLYTDEFYTICKSKLTKDGIFVTQSGCASVLDAKDGVFGPVNATLKKVFGADNVFGYNSYIPSFSSEWGFNIAFQGSPSSMSRAQHDLDAIISARSLNMKWYDSITHGRMFSLPKEVRDLLAKEKRVMTAENPLFMVQSDVAQGIISD